MPQRQSARELLGARGITAKDAATRLGVTSSWFSQVLNGKRPPGPALANGLPLLLGVPAEELFDADLLRLTRTSTHSRPKHQLEARNRRIVQMRLSGLSYREIAQRTGLSCPRVFEIVKAGR